VQVDGGAGVRLLLCCAPWRRRVSRLWVMATCTAPPPRKVGGVSDSGNLILTRGNLPTTYGLHLPTICLDVDWMRVHSGPMDAGQNLGETIS
jgi:hypothetical protein